MRKCRMYHCHRPITGCFGFVKAKDFLAYLRGERETVRELYGLCAEKVSIRFSRWFARRSE